MKRRLFPARRTLVFAIGVFLVALVVRLPAGFATLALPAAAALLGPDMSSGISICVAGRIVMVTLEKKRRPGLCWMREKGVSSVPFMFIGRIFAFVWSAIIATPCETFIGLPIVVGWRSGKITHLPPVLR